MAVGQSRDIDRECCAEVQCCARVEHRGIEWGQGCTYRVRANRDVSGGAKIVVEHADGTVHVGIPKPQSTHAAGGAPKYYDYGNFGHVGE